MLKRITTTLFAAALPLFFGTQAYAEGAVTLPDQIPIVAYDVGTSGYNVTLAFTKPFKEKANSNLRLLPGKNDVARISLLQSGKAEYGALGSDGVYVQEGMYTFGKRKFGPKPVRLIAMNINDGSSAMLAAADAGIKEMSDLRGKKVADVKGSAVSHQFTAAYLAYGGLTWDDVERVEVASFSDGAAALMDGRADAFLSNTNSSAGRKLEASPRGTYFIPVPHDNKEGWNNLNAIIPWIYRHIATKGPTIPETGVEMGTAPYPSLVTLEDQDADKAYNMTKAIFEYYPLYKDSVNGAEGWGIPSQKLSATFIPFHEGAIRYYKEIGIWDDAAEARQQENVKRQKLLKETWAAYVANAPSDEEEFEKGWQEVRAEALSNAGLTLVQKNW